MTSPLKRELKGQTKSLKDKPTPPPVGAHGGEGVLQLLPESRSELGRQVAVDLETDADLDKERGSPGHC
jgi:hypothetical protein